MINAYKNYQKKELQENLIDFVREIVPIAEECKVNMTIHPDDPPVALFGIPKIVSNLNDYKFILNSRFINFFYTFMCIINYNENDSKNSNWYFRNIIYFCNNMVWNAKCAKCF